MARNLTRGRGGLPGAFGAREWVLALKHGLRPDGEMKAIHLYLKSL